MTRFKASFVHFCISLALIGLFLLFAYFIWYGQIYLDISGVFFPAKILIGVDVVLGPLLTLLVFKPAKKHLKLDLMLIALLQLGAFTYGAYTLYLGKPALVVLNEDTFEVVTQKNIKPGLNQELINQLGLFAAPQYAAINPNKVIMQQAAYKQQSFFIPIELDESWVVGQQAPAEIVKRQLNINDTDFSQILIDDDLSGHQYYLMRDTFLNAVLVVKDNVPVKIIHTKKF